MIKIELQIWIICSIIVLSWPCYVLGKYMSARVISWIRSNYQKFQHRKNLEEVKNEIIREELQKSDEKKEEVNDSTAKQKDESVLTNRLERFRLQALALKEKWMLEEYEKKLIEALSLDANNIEFIRMLWDLYFSVGNTKKALPLLKKIIEDYPTDHKTIWQIGQIYIDKNDYHTAKLLVEKAIEYKEDNPKYFVTLAEIHYNLDGLPDSIKMMEKAVRLRPGNIWYLLALASLNEDMGNHGDAVKYYFKALEIEPSNERARSKVQELRHFTS